uniref:Uncharacterized protein n=1 Tax=Oryza barthii TaxID=65489 RepID=A0A0D3HIW2_9ORYZ
MVSPDLKPESTVRASAYPLAMRNLPEPPTMLISLTGDITSFRPMIARLLPLWSPAVNTKFMSIRRPITLWSANVYVPCARPTTSPAAAAAGELVSGSSMATTAPKRRWMLYSTVASPVVALNHRVPRANRNTPVPPTTGISRTARSAGLAPRIARLLPLYGPSPANTKFIAIISDSASLPAATYIPCARPTSREAVRLGPSVSGSSMTYTVPNTVAEALDVGASATFATVEFGPVTTSCQYTRIRVSFCCPAASAAAVTARRSSAAAASTKDDEAAIA